MSSINLTKGPITRQLLQLSAPLLVANLLQQLYNIINSMVVSHFLGENAFAALGVADSIMNLYLFVITGACLGASVLVAQFFGRQDFSLLRREIYVGAVLIGGFTLVIVLFGLAFLPWILTLIQTPQELMVFVSDYLYIILGGMIFAFCYNYLASILRAIGNTRAALMFLLLSLGYNLIAAWILVGWCNLGIRGAAIATVSAQFLSAVLCLLYIYKHQPDLNIAKIDMQLDPVLVRKTISFASVSALHQSSLYLGKLLIQGSVNGLGPSAISAFTAASRTENFFQAIGSSGSESIAIFVAQNRGAGNLARARGGFYRGFALLICSGAMVGAIFLLSPVPLLRLFLNSETSLDSLNIGTSYLMLVGVFYVLSFSGHAFVGYFRGSGKMNIPLMATTAQISLRVLGTWLLIDAMALDSVALSTGLGWVLINIMHGTFYFFDWKNRKKTDNREVNGDGTGDLTL